MTIIKFKPTKEQKKRANKRTSYKFLMSAYDENATLIENTMRFTKQKTPSAAIYAALRRYEESIRSIDELQVENAQLYAELQHYKKGTQHFKDFIAFINYKGNTKDAKLESFYKKRPQIKIPYNHD